MRFRGNLLQRLCKVKYIRPASLSNRLIIVSLHFDAEQLNCQVRIFAGQGFSDLFSSPEVELALFAFAVCVFSSVETAFWRSHVSQHVLQNFFGGYFELASARGLKSLRVSQCQQRLIVKHLFEMWNQPLSIRGVAVEAEAYLIKDAA